MYGKRDGYVSGLAITYKDKTSIFKGTKGMKQATVHDVEMCPRASMFKPDVFWLSFSHHKICSEHSEHPDPSKVFKLSDVI